MKRIAYSVVLVSLTLSVGVLSAHQNPGTATIQGTARDPEGAVLPSARITVVNEDSNEARESIADKDGHFAVKDLVAGIYTLQIRSMCFATYSKTGIILRPSEEKDFDASLPLCTVGSHLDMKKDNFSKKVERNATNSAAEEMIAKAEKIPCSPPPPGSLLVKGEPPCANAKTRDYYFRQLDKIKAKAVELHLPLGGENATVVNAYYGAKATFDAQHHEWIVKISVEFVEECGFLCGWGANRTRAVYFDEAGKTLKVVDGDECDCRWVS